MKLGILSDAHGNIDGLDRCIAALELSGANRFIFLGDSVGYLPGELAVLERLQSIDALCLRGNHEEMLLGNIPYGPQQEASYRLDAVRSRLSQEWMKRIARWPVQYEAVIDGARLLFVHGSPFDPTCGYVYPDTDLRPFATLPYRMVLAGHTHRPFVGAVDSLIFVNAGSCGLPRDVGNLASCAIVDTAALKAEILRVAFDASRLSETLADRISPDVAAVLRRFATGDPVGRVVHV
jgi:putative phosphoesterase